MEKLENMKIEMQSMDLLWFKCEKSENEHPYL